MYFIPGFDSLIAFLTGEGVPGEDHSGEAS